MNYSSQKWKPKKKTDPYGNGASCNEYCWKVCVVCYCSIYMKWFKCKGAPGLQDNPKWLEIPLKERLSEGVAACHLPWLLLTHWCLSRKMCNCCGCIISKPTTYMHHDKGVGWCSWVTFAPHYILRLMVKGCKCKTGGFIWLELEDIWGHVKSAIEGWKDMVGFKF